MKRALGWAALLVMCVACGRSAKQGPVPQAVSPQTMAAGGNAGASPGAIPVAPPNAGAPVAGAAQADKSSTPDVGAPKAFENLTVFPVLSKAQEDLGPLTTLDDAIAHKAAVVRERRAGDDPRTASAQVNSLVIENKGAVAIYVLAGTIVKGGNQDRQIGQDFIIGPKETVPVDAFCVEPGRWTADRNGVQTGGQFGVIGQLSTSDVRAAGQYQQNQSEVWSKVGEVNAAARKATSSGTLLATLDANDVAQKRSALAEKVESYLASVKPTTDEVGLAYAVDGKVRSVRYFANHKLFEMFEKTLVASAAMDAISAQAAATAAGRPVAAAPPVAPTAVQYFMDDVEKQAVKADRDTPAENRNEYKDSGRAYGSSVILKPPAATASPGAKPKKVSSDFVSH